MEDFFESPGFYSVGESTCGAVVSDEVTFASEPVIIDGSFNNFSFERFFLSFSREEIFSILLFAVHHKLLLKEAIKYKLLCHHCGSKLPQFGVNICSISCCGSGKCIHGDKCRLCFGKSMIVATKISEKKAKMLTEMVMKEKYRQVEEFL